LKTLSRTTLAAACITLSIPASSNDEHIRLIEKTPCLEAYRLWAFSSRRPNEFPRPAEFSTAECEAAAVLHDQIQREQYEETRAREAALEVEQRAEGRALAEKQRATARLAASAEAELRRRRAAQAAKPEAKIGMSAIDVISATRWGAPIDVFRTTTKSGVSEDWIYGGRRALRFQDGKLIAIHD
jgi:hypothetical protein